MLVLIWRARVSARSDLEGVLELVQTWRSFIIVRVLTFGRASGHILTWRACVSARSDLRACVSARSDLGGRGRVAVCILTWKALVSAHSDL